MRRLTICGLFCFLIASSYIDFHSVFPSVTAWASRPADDDAPAAATSVHVLTLGPRAPAIKASTADPELGTQPETIGSIGTEADMPDEPPAAPPRRKVSVAEMCDSIALAAQSNNLPVGFLIRLIWQESGFDSSIVSRAGAQGVAQFMPQTAAEWGLDDPFDPLQALPMSARLLRSLHQQFGNWGLAAAAYNAGSGRIQNWLSKRGRLPDETRSYVMNITGHDAETWVNAAPQTVNFRIPARAPCQEIAAASDAEAIPLPPTRVAPRSIMYASETPAKPKRSAGRSSAFISLPKIAAPASIIKLEPRPAAGKTRDVAAVALSQKVLASKDAASKDSASKTKPGKAPVQLAKASASAQEASSAKAAAKSLKRGPVQLAMALRPSVK